MKKISLLIWSLISCSCLIAQEQNFKKNSFNLNAGIGVGGHYAAYTSYTFQTPAIGISGDYGIIEGTGPGTIGAGLYIGYKKLGYKNNYFGGNTPYYYKHIWTYTIVGLRATYYYTLDNPKLDVYGGALLGVLIEKYTHESNDPLWDNYSESDGGGAPSLTVFGGAKYNFTKNLAAFGELGYGISYLTIGASFKLK